MEDDSGSGYYIRSSKQIQLGRSHVLSLSAAHGNAERNDADAAVVWPPPPTFKEGLDFQ